MEKEQHGKYHWPVWGVIAVSRSHWVCPPLMTHALSQPTLLSLWVGLPGRWALGCVHFPGLSHSGSGSPVLHKGTESVGPAFCALPRYEQLRQPGAWQAQSAQVGSVSYHLPYPSLSVSWVAAGMPISGVPCVFSGELISGCDPPIGCQPSRIPKSLG